MYGFIDSCPFYDFSYGGIIMMISFVVLIGIVLYLALRNTGKSDHHTRDRYTEDPIEILKQRYAKGLITKEEYTSMKEDLRR